MESGNIAQWAGLALTAVLFVATLLGHRSRAAKEEVETLDQRVTDLKQDVERLKSDLAHVPNKDAVHNIELLLEQMNGRLGRMEERLEPVKAISERMQELMLEGGKK